MPPLGPTVIVVFFWIAGTAIVGMAVWAGVMAFRLLFSEAPSPTDPVARRRRLAARGESVPVRLRDILEDERARQAVGPPGDSASGRPRAHPLFDDLWLRRN